VAEQDVGISSEALDEHMQKGLLLFSWKRLSFGPKMFCAIRHSTKAREETLAGLMQIWLKAKEF